MARRARLACSLAGTESLYLRPCNNAVTPSSWSSARERTSHKPAAASGASSPALVTARASGDGQAMNPQCAGSRDGKIASCDPVRLQAPRWKQQPAAARWRDPRTCSIAQSEACRWRGPHDPFQRPPRRVARSRWRRRDRLDVAPYRRKRGAHEACRTAEMPRLGGAQPGRHGSAGFVGCYRRSRQGAVADVSRRWRRAHGFRLKAQDRGSRARGAKRKSGSLPSYPSGRSPP
jgi:hypothetical protein